ncbi:HupE/UreJ family protein [Breoghania sp. L-A4]|uniref:HupE/UreJ family protein n=1 Tax=Breoghania sp. L-A4 TaxID=2304600 RepID=UPI000E35F371|nr:HupE/UreJ family protein [Breoghania sp. L-A4]AXS38762.1 hypothetical protein D1F64_00190 [Breoghania sp. L-A4]
MTFRKTLRLAVPATLAALPALAATPALAHPGLHEGSTLLSGLMHPLGGADHVLAMVAVGVWSALSGGRNRLVWPAVFVAAMLGGFTLSASGIAVPLVEPGILASVVILGLLIAMTPKVPTALGAGIVGFFALFHGAAHGLEAPAGGLGPYALGFAAATASLHLAGLGFGMLANERAGRRALRIGGAFTAVAGVALTIGA